MHNLGQIQPRVEGTRQIAKPGSRFLSSFFQPCFCLLKKIDPLEWSSAQYHVALSESLFLTVKCLLLKAPIGSGYLDSYSLPGLPQNVHNFLPFHYWFRDRSKM